MPKSAVYSKTDQDSKVEVSWARERDVQISVVTKKPDLIKALEESPPVEGFNGFFLDLDRSGINGLIKMLRRARDDAYGKDE